MSETSIVVTHNAAKQINAILAKDASGFSYKFDLETQTTDDDTIIEVDGAQVAVDSASVPFLEGSKIDYVDELLGAAFKIDNPNAVAACGCGVSFTI